MIGIAERLRVAQEQYKRPVEQSNFDLRVAAPGIIQSFDPVKLNVTVQLAIRENMLQQVGDSGTVPIFNREPVAVWPLVNVPIAIPRGGGYSVTLPIAPGDECLVIFCDRSIDGWLQSGGIQNQVERRAHDLADAFAIIGIWNQTRKLVNYSQSSIQIRNDAGDTYLEIIGGQVTVTDNFQVLNGASGTVTTQTGQILTFQNGILINIG